jgi:hypothetical protein
MPFQKLSPTLFSIVSLCISLSLFSCTNDSTEPTVTDSPEVTIVSPVADLKVKGKISVSVTTSSPVEIELLSVFIDDIEISHVTSNNNINVEFDTKTLDDGPHTLKATSKDKKGNVGEKSVTFEIHNYLFVATVPTGFLHGTEVHLFFSRNDGSLIQSYKVEDGEIIMVPTPEDFDPNDTFIYNTFTYLNSDYVKLNVVVSYEGFKAGNYTFFPPWEDNSNDDFGSVDFSITGLGDFTSARLGGEHIGSTNSIQSGNSFSAKAYLTSTSSDLFASIKNYMSGDALYKYYEKVKSGDAYNENATTFTSMNSKTLDVGSSATNYFSIVYAEGVEKGKFWPVDFNSSNDSLTFYYPGQLFKNYQFYATITNNNVWQSFQKFAATPPSTFDFLNANLSNISLSNDKLQINTTGNYDIIFASAVNVDNNLDTLVIEGMEIALPEGSSQQIVIPELPETISKFNVSKPATPNDFHYVYIYDIDKYENVNDYHRNTLFMSDKSGLLDMAWKEIRLSNGQPQGRVGSPEGQGKDWRQLLRDRSIYLPCSAFDH